MTIAQLIAFNLALFAAMASPGPAFLIAVRTAVVNGRAAGIAIGFGLAIMASTWTLLALAGLESVFRLFPWAYVFVKTAGAIFLSYTAWKMWRSANEPVVETIKPTSHAFRQGLLVNLANPKALLFAGAVLIVIFPVEMSFFAKGFVVLNQLFLEILFYSALTFAMSTKTIREKYLRLKPSLDKVAALVLGALGLRLLVSR